MLIYFTTIQNFNSSILFHVDDKILLYIPQHYDLLAFSYDILNTTTVGNML